MIFIVNGRTVHDPYPNVQFRSVLQAWRRGFPAQASAVENFLNVDTRGFVSERTGIELDE